MARTVLRGRGRSNASPLPDPSVLRVRETSFGYQGLSRSNGSLALQTEEYTRALVEAGSTRDVEGEMVERAQRKAAILDREDFPDLWVIMDEGVMARLVGGRAIMADQLRHLLKMADESYVSLRIVPFASGATVGVDGSLQIMRLETRDVAYAGAQGGGRLIESPSDVRQMGDKFERIGVKALSEDGSREIIKNYLEMYA
ncbi:DUF5753 domain-containing protein [Actinomadura luteofluorescens]|uniref:DUF5753 domain-containing protein n=1 Tax=Actinomadura luteofluorescens TaxID=46163 RepID=UPI0030CB8AA0